MNFSTELSKKPIKFIIISSFGTQAELPGTYRIYGLVKGLKENSIDSYLLTPESKKVSSSDIDKLTKLIELKKSLLQKITESLLSLVENIKSKSQTNYKTAYSKGSALMAYYTFFFFGKSFIPLIRLTIKSRKLTKQAIKEKHIPIVFTSSSPGAMHLIGFFIKKKFKKNVIWIADFQDPLEDDPILRFPNILPSKITDNLVFFYADRITSPSENALNVIKKTALKRGINIEDKLTLLPFGVILKKPKHQKEENWIIYGGTVYQERSYGLKVLFEALKELPEFKFVYAGFTPEIVKDLQSETGLENERLIIHDILPKKEFEDLVSKSKIILVLGTFTENYKVLGSKVYEMLGFKKPLLIISPDDADSSNLLKEIPLVYFSKPEKYSIIETIKQIQKQLLQINRQQISVSLEKLMPKQIVYDFLAQLKEEGLISFD